MKDPKAIAQLSESQRLCLRLVARGMSSKEIAIETGLSPRTIDQYINIAQTALGATNRREAARMLVASEADALNKLQLKPPPIAEPVESAILSLSEPSDTGKVTGGKLLLPLPGLGGAREERSYAETVTQIIYAAVIAAVGFGGIVAAGAWLHTLFS